MSRFTRGIVCLGMCSGFILNADDPAWYSQPQFFDTFSFYTFNADPLLRQIPFTGLAKPGDAGLIPVTLQGIVEDRAEIAASRNSELDFAYLNLDVELGSLSKDLLSEWDPFRLRAIDGSYLDNTAGTSDTPQGDFPIYSLSSPVYLSVQLARAQAAVDCGFWGSSILDSVFDPVASIVSNSAARAGSFDSVTMAAFTTHLQKTYSAAQLQSMFGLATAANLNLGIYIQTKGLSTTWNQKPFSDPLVAEFYQFQLQQTLTFLKTLISTTKQYAQQKYDRDFLF